MASPALAVAEFAEDTATPQEDVEEQEENDEVRALKYTTSALWVGRHIISIKPPQLVVPLCDIEYFRYEGGGSAFFFTSQTIMVLQARVS